MSRNVEDSHSYADWEVLNHQTEICFYFADSCFLHPRQALVLIHDQVFEIKTAFNVYMLTLNHLYFYTYLLYKYVNTLADL